MASTQVECGNARRPARAIRWSYFSVTPTQRDWPNSSYDCRVPESNMPRVAACPKQNTLNGSRSTITSAILLGKWLRQGKRAACAPSVGLLLMPLPVLRHGRHHHARFSLAPEKVTHRQLPDARIPQGDLLESDQARAWTMILSHGLAPVPPGPRSHGKRPVRRPRASRHRG